MGAGERVLHDAWFLKAKAEGYLARSAYKLKHIQDRHRVIPRGGLVLDLGCAPGAWLQVACEALGPGAGGRVLGLDIAKVESPVARCDGRVSTIVDDARRLARLPHSDLRSALMLPTGDRFQAVLSDMLAPTTGDGATDAARSLSLALSAARIALGRHNVRAEGEEGDEFGLITEHVPGGVLARGGAFVVKLLESQDSRGFASALKQHFAACRFVRPPATRPQSSEIYLVGLDRRIIA